MNVESLYKSSTTLSQPSPYAAHSLRPVAGQGFNLAMRDVTLLSKTIEPEEIYDGFNEVLQLFPAVIRFVIKKIDSRCFVKGMFLKVNGRMLLLAIY